MLLSLVYHDIRTGDPQIDRQAVEDRPYVLDPEVFEAQLRILAQQGFQSATSRDLVAWASGRSPIPAKLVILTFDDGHISNFTEAVPLLERYGFRAIFFITTDLIGRSNMVGRDHLVEMAKRGMEIGSHTVTHAIPVLLSEQQLERELVESKATLEDLLGQPVCSISSPTGFHDARMKPLARQAGYETLFVGITSLWRPAWPLDMLWINRTDIKASLSMGVFEQLAMGHPLAGVQRRTIEWMLGQAKTVLGPSRYNKVRTHLLERSPR